MSNAVQLDLFQGVLLTTKQQEEVDGFVKRKEKYAVNAEKRISETMLMLDEAGFVYGEDYGSDFKVHKVTHKREFGYSYDNTDYMHEVTYMNSVGNVYLKVNRIKDGVVVKYNSSVSKEGDKLMCTSVTSQYRYYKPSSLLTKYKEHNQRVINELEHKNKQSIALDTIVKKYQTLYPDATVTIGSDFYRNRGNFTDFPIVKVLFKSGSWVSFQLGYSNNMEEVRFYKKHDAKKETNADLLERFNNQKAQ